MPLYEIDGSKPTLPEDGSSWVAPSADVIGEARLGKEVGIWFGAVIRADNTPSATTPSCMAARLATGC
jgi:carbonic anhydrase/acetyltransferase-like protein (isoleucine patch superfamily)